MSHLTRPDAVRLAKLLGMFGSDHQGERDAAALAAHRFIRSLNVQWIDILDPPTPDRSSTSGVVSWRDCVTECLRHANQLTNWERGFLGGLPSFERLSPKQANILNKIADRVLNGERA